MSSSSDLSICSKLAYDGLETEVSTYTASAVNMSTDRTSALDVYARPYIPQVLKEVNKLPAKVVPSEPAPWINFPSYVQSFAGYRFLHTNFSNPTIPQEDITHSIDTNSLHPKVYSTYFASALIHESIAQQKECNEHSLYRVPLSPAGVRDPRGPIYWLHVPGLRETDLRIEIGDIVQVRPLTLNMYGEAQLDRLNPDWNHNFAAPPSSLTVQHDAFVWGIDRLREILSLRIDYVNPANQFYNVSFTVQKPRFNAALRAVQDLHSHLDTRVNGWARSMILPQPADGHLQRTLNSSSFSLELYDQSLNYEQLRAIDTVLKNDYGCVPYLVSGPPGTGKTMTVVEMALQLMKRQRTARLLLCAPSDPASDTLVRRLSKHLGPDALLRLNSPSRSFPEVPDAILPFCYVENDIFSLPPFPSLMQKKIVVVTCRDAELLRRARVTNNDLYMLERVVHNALHPEFDAIEPPLHWDGLIMDEAAQATEPEALIPLLVVAPPSEAEAKSYTLPAVVMVGDQNQLGPRTASNDVAIRTSLFERLLSRPIYASHPLARTAQSGGVMRPLTQEMLPIIRPPFTNLVRNYRSHPAILATPSSLFYNDTLEPCAEQTDTLTAWPGFGNPHMPVLFASNTSQDEIETLDGGGWFNLVEAQRAIAYARSFLSLRFIHQQSDICIMSPFRAQVRVLRQRAREASLGGVNVGPLEAFQGLESRLVILCTTRTRDRFIDEDRARGLGVVYEPRRFNVALTRAKEGLIVIGNPELLVKDDNWAVFLGFCARNECWEGEGAERWIDERRGKEIVSRLEARIMRPEQAASEEDVDTVIGKARRLGLGHGDDHDFWEAGIAAEKALSGA